MSHNTPMPNFDLDQENISNLLCNISSYYFPPEAEYYFRLIDQILYILTGVVGIPGNFLAMIALSNMKLRSLDNFCLVFVAFFDNVLLFAVYYRDFIGGSPLYLSWTVVLSKIAWGCSIWATVSFLAMYYVNVCFSVKGKIPLTHKTVGLLNLFILLFTICYNIPHFYVLQQLSWDVDLVNSFPYYFTSHSLPQSMKQNAVFLETWCIYFDAILLYFVPTWFALGFSWSSYIGLLMIWKNRREMALLHQSKRPRDKIRVHFLMTSFFFYSYAAIFIIAVSKVIPGVLPSCRHISVAGGYIVCMNSGLKFLLYVILWKDFRDTLGKITGIDYIFRKLFKGNAQLREEPEPQTLVLPKQDIFKNVCSSSPKVAV